MKKVVALDLDDLIYPFVPPLVPFLSKELNRELCLEDFHTFTFDEVLGCQPGEAFYMVNRFFFSLKEHPSPIEGAIESIKELSEHFTLVIVTSRDESLRDMTTTWLDQHFGTHLNDLQLCGTYDPKNSNARTKAAVCREIGAIALVDDVPPNLESIASDGKQGLLFGDFPWNRHAVLPDGVVRVSDWNEVTKTLMEMK